MSSVQNHPKNEENWLDDELDSRISTNPAGLSQSRSVNSLRIVLIRMKPLTGRPALFFLILCYCVLSNLWLHSADYIDQLGLSTDPLEFWLAMFPIYLGLWLTQHLSLPGSYSSVQASLITGIVSAISLSICFHLVVKRFPILLRISVMLFFLLTVAVGVSYSIEFYRLKVYLATPHESCCP